MYVCLLREHGAEWIFKRAWIYPRGQIQCDDTEDSLPSLFHRVNQIWLKFKLKCILSLSLSLPLSLPSSLHSGKLNAPNTRASAVVRAPRARGIVHLANSWRRESDEVISSRNQPRCNFRTNVHQSIGRYCAASRWYEISRYLAQSVRCCGDTLSIDCEQSSSRK